MSYFGTYSLEGGLLSHSVLACLQEMEISDTQFSQLRKENMLLLFNLSEQALINTEL